MTDYLTPATEFTHVFPGFDPSNSEHVEYQRAQEELRALTVLNAKVVRTVMDMLSGNPMMAMSLGPQFKAEAENVSTQITLKLTALNENGE